MTAHLNERQVARIKALLMHAERGETVKIARFFDVSVSRVKSYRCGYVHADVEPAPLSELAARTFLENLPGDTRVVECNSCLGVIEYEHQPMQQRPSLCSYCGFEECEQCGDMFPVRRPSEVGEQRYCSPRCKKDSQISTDAERPSHVPEGQRWCPACDCVKSQMAFPHERRLRADGSLGYERRCRACHRALRRSQDHRRRARKTGAATGEVTSLLLARMRRRAKRCYWCKRRFRAGETIHVDHVIPLARGGPDCRSNVCAACADCNHSKHAKLPGPEWVPREQVPLCL